MSSQKVGDTVIQAFPTGSLSGFYAIPENHADYYHLDPCWGGAHITLAGCPKILRILFSFMEPSRPLARPPGTGRLEVEGFGPSEEEMHEPSKQMVPRPRTRRSIDGGQAMSPVWAQAW